MGIPHISTCVLVLCAVSVLAGCGIPALEALAAPVVLDADIPLPLETVVTFTNNPVNNKIEFIGFELYYRFYADSGLLINDTDYIKASQTPDISALTARRFRRIRFFDDDAKPLIRVAAADKGMDFGVSIDFDTYRYPAVTVDAAASSALLSGNIVRYVKEEGGTDAVAKGFTSSDIDEGDEDLPETSSAFVDMALFVIAYGYSADLREIYSEPVFLGYIQRYLSS